MNKKQLITAIKVVAGVIFFLFALGWAGNSDYEDAVVVEMKNNGAYWELSEQHPNASDSELVSIYMDEKD